MYTYIYIYMIYIHFDGSYIWYIYIYIYTLYIPITKSQIRHWGRNSIANLHPWCEPCFLVVQQNPAGYRTANFKGYNLNQVPGPVGATFQNGNAWICILCISEKNVFSMKTWLVAKFIEMLNRSRHERTYIYIYIYIYQRERDIYNILFIFIWSSTSVKISVVSETFLTSEKVPVNYLLERFRGGGRGVPTAPLSQGKSQKIRPCDVSAFAAGIAWNCLGIVILIEPKYNLITVSTVRLKQSSSYTKLAWLASRWPISERLDVIHHWGFSSNFGANRQR